MSSQKQSPKALIFLGNPGGEYEKTRHNAGFLFANQAFPGQSWEKKFHGLHGQAQFQRQDSSPWKLWLLKPETYMNQSGKSARAFQQFYKLEAEELLVVFDQLELPCGSWRFRQNGGLAGHKGLRSLVEQGLEPQFHRLELGIGRPEKGSVSSHVLGRFQPWEEALFEKALKEAAQALGFTGVVNAYVLAQDLPGDQALEQGVQHFLYGVFS